MTRGCRPLSQSNEGARGAQSGRSTGKVNRLRRVTQPKPPTEELHVKKRPGRQICGFLVNCSECLRGDAQDEGEALTCLNMDAPAPPPQLGCDTPWPDRERSRCLGPAPWACRRSRNS